MDYYYYSGGAWNYCRGTAWRYNSDYVAEFRVTLSHSRHPCGLYYYNTRAQGQVYEGGAWRPSSGYTVWSGSHS